MAFPNNVLGCAPVPGDFIGETLPEWPDFHVFPGTISAIHPHETALFNLKTKPCLEAISRFIAYQCQVLSGFWDHCTEGGQTASTMLRRAQKPFSTEEI